MPERQRYTYTLGAHSQGDLRLMGGCSPRPSLRSNDGGNTMDESHRAHALQKKPDVKGGDGLECDSVSMKF